MFKRRHGPCLTLETSESVRVLGRVFRKELQRNPTRKPDILGTIDEAHAAATQAVQNLVVRNRFASQRKDQILKLSAHAGFYGDRGLPIASQQSIHLSSQYGVVRAGVVEQRRANGRIAIRSAMKKLLNLRPTFRSQVVPTRPRFRAAATPLPSSSRDARLLPKRQASALSLPWRARQNSEAPRLCIFGDRASPVHSARCQVQEGLRSVLARN